MIHVKTVELQVCVIKVIMGHAGHIQVLHLLRRGLNRTRVRLKIFQNGIWHICVDMTDMLRGKECLVAEARCKLLHIFYVGAGQFVNPKTLIRFIRTILVA